MGLWSMDREVSIERRMVSVRKKFTLCHEGVRCKTSNEMISKNEIPLSLARLCLNLKAFVLAAKRGAGKYIVFVNIFSTILANLRECSKFLFKRRRLL